MPELTSKDDYYPSGWWKVVYPDGKFSMETRDADNAKALARAHPEAKLYREFESSVYEWREVKDDNHQPDN